MSKLSISAYVYQQHSHQKGVYMSSRGNQGTFGRSVPVFLSPQHPVYSLALIGPEHGDESLVLNITGHFLAVSLMQVPDVIVQLLHILPLQVCVAIVLLVLYHFYRKNSPVKGSPKFYYSTCHAVALDDNIHQIHTLTGNNEIIEVLH